MLHNINTCLTTAESSTSNTFILFIGFLPLTDYYQARASDSLGF